MVAMVAGGVLTMVGIWIGFNQQLSDFGREKGKPGKGKKEWPCRDRSGIFPWKGNREIKKLKNRNTDLDFAPYPMLKKGAEKVFLFPLFPLSQANLLYI